MNYQIEPQTIHAAKILEEAKKIIDESGIEAELWEILSSTPLSMIDHDLNQMRTLQSVKNGKIKEVTVFFQRLEWKDYQMVTELINTISQALYDA